MVALSRSTDGRLIKRSGKLGVNSNCCCGCDSLYPPGASRCTNGTIENRIVCVEVTISGVENNVCSICSGTNGTDTLFLNTGGVYECCTNGGAWCTPTYFKLPGCVGDTQYPGRFLFARFEECLPRVTAHYGLGTGQVYGLNFYLSGQEGCDALTELCNGGTIVLPFQKYENYGYISWYNLPLLCHFSNINPETSNPEGYPCHGEGATASVRLVSCPECPSVSLPPDCTPFDTCPNHKTFDAHITEFSNCEYTDSGIRYQWFWENLNGFYHMRSMMEAPLGESHCVIQTENHFYCKTGVYQDATTQQRYDDPGYLIEIESKVNDYKIETYVCSVEAFVVCSSGLVGGTVSIETSAFLCQTFTFLWNGFAWVLQDNPGLFCITNQPPLVDPKQVAPAANCGTEGFVMCSFFSNALCSQTQNYSLCGIVGPAP